MADTRRALREVMHYASVEVSRKFPEMGAASATATVVAGFHFLRMLCPAIASPDAYGFVHSTVRCCAANTCRADQRSGEACAGAGVEADAEPGQWVDGRGGLHGAVQRLCHGQPRRSTGAV